jgi:magnesium-transporting ATPase (P-type)
VLTEGQGRERRARISVRGLDRSPGLARKVVQLLERRYGVKARARPLTGHVLVEYDHYQDLLDKLVTEVARLELPALPGEDRPEHPLDPAPLRQAVARAIGSVLGLGVLTVQRLRTPGGVGNGLASVVASVLNLLHGAPFIQNRLRKLLGKNQADLLSNGLDIVVVTLANFPLGLIITGLEALVLMSEVMARRAAWVRYEDSLVGAESAEPGAVIRLEAGMKVPRPARVIEGTGTASSTSGLPAPLSPGATVPAGATLSGGPFVVELQGEEAFVPEPRPPWARRTFYHRYLRHAGWFSLAYAGLTAMRTGSLARTFESLLLLNPRPAVIGREAANLRAAARALRAGLTVIGTRPDRVIQLPDVLMLSGPRLLCDGLEVGGVLPLAAGWAEDDVLIFATSVSAAAGSPWGSAFPLASIAQVSGAQFNGLWATATVDGDRYTLGPSEDPDLVPDAFLSQHEGGFLLELRLEEENKSLGLVALRPRLAPGTKRLVTTCHRLGVSLEVLASSAPQAATGVARQLDVKVVPSADGVASIRARQNAKAMVALVSDSTDAAPAFAACDLAVGLASPRHGDFQVRADVLAPDLHSVVDLLEVAARREQALRDAVCLAAAANGIGIVLGFSPAALGLERASLAVYLAAFAALGTGWIRMRGGTRPESAQAYLSDPRPERWGRHEIAETLRAFDTSERGLSSAAAAARRVAPVTSADSYQFLSALRNQLRTPITSLMAGGACVTLVLGQPLNTALLGLTISLNIAAGIWQEREVGKASEALRRMAAGSARVLRNGVTVTVAATDVVPGDILILGPGDRVSADARMLSSAGLEIDEAALTGESLPVAKGPDEASEAGRIVLEGSDVVVGTGRAVVVGVGRRTRLGATAAALNIERTEDSPMGARLGRILHFALPVAGIGGAVAGAAGLLYGGTPINQLTVGVTTALSAIPEGLPLLAGVGQAAVANRLASRGALVRRVAAIEVLGRVDFACTDKTGTMTEGRLALRLLANGAQEAPFPGPLSLELRRLLLTAALASPHPNAPDARAHPTDMAVIRGAIEAGMEELVLAPRRAEVGFDSVRAFHAALVGDRLCVKGAPERLIPRCRLDEESSAALNARATRLAERGLRVLMVAEGSTGADPDDPQDLSALGFVGISDPLRPTVPEAVRRCQAAGIRVIMLTGDHPATARAIAREAGLLYPGHDEVVRAAELTELPPEQMDRRLEGVAAIARATPMDKLQVIESLKRRGHTVAMTGDGVNDAPSLRLADVGVAMGRGGTEVARQAADVVLLDDDFATLVEALVEGRGFWRNMRTALGLLLGGNAGELGLIAGASLMGFGSPLNAVQILLVNLITDALPSLAVVLQRPEHRNLAKLAREGLFALDKGLKRDVLRRGLATGLPSLAAYLLMHQLSGPTQASAVAFTGVVATQLAQTLDAGRVQGTISSSVVKAVAASVGLLVSSVSIPPLRNFLGLLSPSPLGWGVVAASSAAAVLLSRAITILDPLRVASPGVLARPGEYSALPPTCLPAFRETGPRGG